MPNIHLVKFPGPSLEILRNPVLRCVGRCSNIPGYSIQKHAHDTMELIYIVSGNGTVNIDGTQYALRPGDIAIYNPGVCHAERFDNNGEAPVFYHIKFDELSVSGMTVNNLLPVGLPPVFDTLNSSFAFKSLMSTMFREATEQILDRLLQCIILLTLRVLDSSYNELRKNDSDSLVYQIQSYFAENFASKLSMSDVADRFHITDSYLSHLFKKSIGLSPTAYLTEFRINEACRLLSQTALSIYTIAEEVGYANQSNFQYQFKKSKGMSPLQYRSNYNDKPLKHSDIEYR